MGAAPFCPGLILRPCRDGSLTQVRGCARTGLRGIWEKQGHWAGARWVRPGRALTPLAHSPSLPWQATDELGRRREDTHPSPPPESPVLGRPSLPPRPLPAVLHCTAVLDTEPTEAKSEGEKAGVGCLWLCGEGSVLGPTGRSPHRPVWGQEPRLGSEHPGGGLHSGRRPGEGSFVAAASPGGPGLGSVSAKPQGEAGPRVTFSPLPASPVEELDQLPTSATPEGHMVSGVTSAGDREPTGARAPAHGDADAVQGELAPAPAPTPASASPPSPAPARATPTSPAPACAPVLALDPDPPLVPPLPRPLPGPLFLPQTQLLPLTSPRPSPLPLPQLLPLPLPLTLLLSLQGHCPGTCPCTGPRPRS